jgi:hypothetical protein
VFLLMANCLLTQIRRLVELVCWNSRCKRESGWDGGLLQGEQRGFEIDKRREQGGLATVAEVGVVATGRDVGRFGAEDA